MKTRTLIINLASIIAILSLAISLTSGFCAFFEIVSMDQYKTILDLSTLVWFLTSPLWFVPQLFGHKFAEAGKAAWLTPKKS